MNNNFEIKFKQVILLTIDVVFAPPSLMQYGCITLVTIFLLTKYELSTLDDDSEKILEIIRFNYLFRPYIYNQ